MRMAGWKPGGARLESQRGRVLTGDHRLRRRVGSAKSERMKHTRWIASLLWLLAGTGALRAQMHEWEAGALPKVKLETVRFRGWTPATEKLSGTLVLIPGRHGDGRGMAADKRWQALAEELEFALLACQFSNGDPSLYQFDEAGEVAGAIEDAVARLAKESGHAELEKAPLALWGTSAGSNVAARFCARVPGRVAAFASSKGTFGPGQVPAAAMDIPMFFAVGGKDQSDWVQASMESIGRGLSGKAPWTLALSPTEGHGVGESLDVAVPFLSTTVRQRLGRAEPASGGESGSIFTSKIPMAAPTSGGGKAPAKLQKLSLREGWLGNPESYEIAAYADYKGSKSKAIWLPDEATAQAWQSYLKK